MNYKVSFYENLTELLIERKANYINQLKKLTTKITNALGEKMVGEGTLTEKILARMIDNRDSGR